MSAFRKVRSTNIRMINRRYSFLDCFSVRFSAGSGEALWTVTHLTEAMDRLGTAASTRQQPDHNLLGQVIVWTSDLTTAAWITTQLDVAVTHTDHSVYEGDSITFFKGLR